MSLLSLPFTLLRSLRGRNRCVDHAHWYISQENNPVSCGAAVAAMGVRWTGQQCVPDEAFTPWYFRDISAYLNKLNVSQQSSTSLAFSEDQAAIARIRAGRAFPHFVLITWRGDELLVSDPLTGTRLQTPKRLGEELISQYCLVIDRD